MSNAAGTRSSREEEIAFLIMEDVLGVDIHLADAGAGDKEPDGAWTIASESGRGGIVEITSPPDKELLKKWAQAKRDGVPQAESGSIPVYLNELDKFCTDLLGEDWALENIAKLLAKPADERHLFLFGRSYKFESYFYRLSDEYDTGRAEPVGHLVLPDGLSSVWFRGRAAHYHEWGIRIWVARFQTGSGWHRQAVDIDERHLPSPNPGMVDDKVTLELRTPKDRSR